MLSKTLLQITVWRQIVTDCNLGKSFLLSLNAAVFAGACRIELSLSGKTFFILDYFTINE